MESTAGCVLVVLSNMMAEWCLHQADLFRLCTDRAPFRQAWVQNHGLRHSRTTSEPTVSWGAMCDSPGPD